MSRRNRIVIFSAVLPLGVAALGATAPSASANECFMKPKGRVCINGFDPGDKGPTQFTGVLNSYDFDVEYMVTAIDGSADTDCIESGDIRWYDNAIYRVDMNYYSEYPVPCAA